MIVDRARFDRSFGHGPAKTTETSPVFRTLQERGVARVQNWFTAFSHDDSLQGRIEA